MFTRSVRQILGTRLRGSIMSRNAGGIAQRASSTIPSVLAASDESRWNMATAAAALIAVTATVATTTQCEENTPSSVAKEDLEEVTAEHSMDTLPIFEADFVAQHNGEDGTRIWMTYGGIVYDVTDFIPNHPGGSEQIMKAAGGVRAV